MFKDLRVWAVWAGDIGRIEYLSESYNDCCKIQKLHAKSGHAGLMILRFDLSPTDRDFLSSRSASLVPTKTKTH